MQTANTIWNIFRSYNGVGYMLLIFLAALLYVLWRVDRTAKRYIVIAIVAAVILVFNNISVKVVNRIFGDATYYRFIWMVPIVPTIAYAVMDLIVRSKKLLTRCLVGVSAAVLLFMGGDFCVTSDSVTMPWNVRYINPETREVAHIIMEDSQREHPMVVCPAGLGNGLRVADANLVIYIDRRFYLAGSMEESTSSNIKDRRMQHMYMAVNGAYRDVDVLSRILRKVKIAYVALAKDSRMEETFIAAGCEMVGQTANYLILRNPNAPQ